ncbi:MAG: hypothetical protein HQK54_11450 [Oligoflexales bacterium]|nr:hypothetical protein [Oligoflexales bacterium]
MTSEKNIEEIRKLWQKWDGDITSLDRDHFIKGINKFTKKIRYHSYREYLATSILSTLIFSSILSSPNIIVSIIYSLLMSFCLSDIIYFYFKSKADPTPENFDRSLDMIVYFKKQVDRQIRFNELAFISYVFPYILIELFFQIYKVYSNGFAGYFHDLILVSGISMILINYHLREIKALKRQNAELDNNMSATSD